MGGVGYKKSKIFFFSNIRNTKLLKISAKSIVLLLENFYEKKKNVYQMSSLYPMLAEFFP